MKHLAFLGVTVAGLLVSGCSSADFLQVVDREKQERTYLVCMEYINWKADKLENLQKLTDAEVQQVNFWSTHFRAFCDDDPSTTTNYTLEGLEGVMEGLKQ